MGIYTIPEVKSDYSLEVARGNITGVKGVNKFGRHNDVDATEETIWDGHTDYNITPTFPATAVITHVWSTLDAVADQNALIYIEGLSSTYAAVTQSKALDGSNSTTAVLLDTALIRVNRMWVDYTATPTGSVRVGDSGKAAYYSEILTGNNQTGQAIYTVPLGKKLYLYNVYMDMNSAAGTAPSVSWKLYAHDAANSKVRRVHLFLGTVGAGNSHIAHSFPTPWEVGAKWSIYINAVRTSGASALDCSAGFEGYLVDD